MGVTLERVQNKFACIIGELCSEPDILSQFAIWLDLRLAEYKAKGAISLEISGEDPDPSWLRGHKPAAPPVQSRDTSPDMYNPAGGSDSNFNSDIGHPHMCEDRLSPEVVIVKNEPGDSEPGDVFPISLHGNSNFVGSPHHHKRKHSQTLTSGSSIHHSSSFLSSSSSPAKIHRSSQSSSLSTPGTQSLMSIISDIPGSSSNNTTSADQNLDSSRLSDTTQSKGDNILPGYRGSNSGSHSANLQGSSSGSRITESHAKSDSKAMLDLDSSLLESQLIEKVPLPSKTCNDIFGSFLRIRPSSRNWTQEDMEKAIEAVQSGKLSQRAASRMYNIPQTTIHRRLAGKVRPHFCSVDRTQPRSVTHTCVLAGSSLQSEKSQVSPKGDNSARDSDDPSSVEGQVPTENEVFSKGDDIS